MKNARERIEDLVVEARERLATVRKLCTEIKDDGRERYWEGKLDALESVKRLLDVEAHRLAAQLFHDLSGRELGEEKS